MRPPSLLLPVAACLLLAAPASAATIPVTTTEDTVAADGSCSLREAISAANSDAATGGCPAGADTDTITVPAGTYELSRAGDGEDANSTGDLDVTESVTIDGADAGSTTVDAKQLDRAFHVVTDATVTIEGLTVRGGRTPDGDAGTPHTPPPATFAIGGNGAPSADGGGILSAGTLTLERCRVTENETGDGGPGARPPAATGSCPVRAASPRPAATRARAARAAASRRAGRSRSRTARSPPTSPGAAASAEPPSAGTARTARRARAAASPRLPRAAAAATRASAAASTRPAP